MEYFWAERILSSGASLHDFPYYSNYNRLTDFELGAIRRHRNLADQRMLYVGNGALPFTALMYSRKEKGLLVDCLDRDLKSRELGAKIFEYTGVKGSFHLGDIADADLQLEKYDILFICALVGSSNEEKNAWLERMHPRLNKGSLVVVRSVPDDHRKLLYPQFTFSPENSTRYIRLGEYIPPREIKVINSIQLAEPK